MLRRLEAPLLGAGVYKARAYTGKVSVDHSHRQQHEGE